MAPFSNEGTISIIEMYGCPVSFTLQQEWPMGSTADNLLSSFVSF